jgi:hypothetical protein
MDPEPDRDALKAKFAVAGRKVLLTFGLLSPNRGRLFVRCPQSSTVSGISSTSWRGRAHLAILRREGEGYRTMLARQAEKLGVREHVVLRRQFVWSDELREYLQAADILISPYLNEAQATSGALSYAMGPALPWPLSRIGMPRSLSRASGDHCFRSKTMLR